jgi:hypothetical protein
MRWDGGIVMAQLMGVNKLPIYQKLVLCKQWDILSGWWFGTLFIFPYIGKNHPN